MQIKIDPRNPNILDKFSEFVKGIAKESWEKPNFMFAQYLDMLDSSPTVSPLPPDQLRRRKIQKIYYFQKSL